MNKTSKWFLFIDIRDIKHDAMRQTANASLSFIFFEF